MNFWQIRGLKNFLQKGKKGFLGSASKASKYSKGTFEINDNDIFGKMPLCTLHIYTAHIRLYTDSVHSRETGIPWSWQMTLNTSYLGKHLDNYSSPCSVTLKNKLSLDRFWNSKEPYDAGHIMLKVSQARNVSWITNFNHRSLRREKIRNAHRF